MSLLNRFTENKNTVIKELLKQKLVLNDPNIAEKIFQNGELVLFKPGDKIIQQDTYDQDIYFLLAGEADIVVNGKKLPYTRKAGLTIGEMSAINPTKPRSATLIANSDTIAIKVTSDFFNSLAQDFPTISQLIAVDLAERLEERNQLIEQSNQNPRLFIISTIESLAIAQNIKLALDYDEIEVTIWNENGVFNAGSYTLESLERAVKESDFGLAVMQGDDIINSRGNESAAPRDNIIFELGLFMGHLTRSRTLLALPRGEKIKIASDLQGLTPLEYKINSQGQADVSNLVMALRNHILSLGPRMNVHNS